MADPNKRIEAQRRFQASHPHYNEFQCWKRRLKNSHKKGKKTDIPLMDYEEYLEKEHGITPEQLPFYLASLMGGEKVN